MMKELIFTSNRETSELIISSFYAVGINSLRIEDTNAINEFDDSTKMWDYFDDSILFSPNDSVSIIAYINESDIDESLNLILQDLKQMNVYDYEYKIKDYIDINWLNEWKKYYSTQTIGRYRVIPHWEKGFIETNNHNIDIYIEPGYAFGTGEHDTTQMCLQIMSSIDLNGKSVVDIGTGSGILGIAAIKSGAKKVAFLDIDSDSIKMAKQNLAINLKKTGNHLFIKSNLLTEINEKFQVILANITADPLILLSEQIDKCAEKNTILVCSGIIASREKDVVDAYAKRGFNLIKKMEKNSWIALLLKSNV